MPADAGPRRLPARPGRPAGRGQRRRHSARSARSACWTSAPAPTASIRCSASTTTAGTSPARTSTPSPWRAAATIVQANRLEQRIDLRQQHDPRNIFQDLLLAEERFDLTLCNPPFHASADEASRGSQRKWRNLGKLDPKRTLPLLNFGGQAGELYCDGGEAAFIARLAGESALFAGQVYWFSSLVSKAANLPALQRQLGQLGAREVRTVAMAQGQKQSRFVAWTFLSEAQREAWRSARWAQRGDASGS